MIRLARSLCALAFVALLSVPTFADGIVVSADPEMPEPGDAITVNVTGAPTNDVVIVFLSLDNTPSTLDMFRSNCGDFQLELGLTPRIRLRLRTDQDGNASHLLPVSRGLSSRFIGSTFFLQAASVQIDWDPRTKECTVESCVSEMSSFTLGVTEE